MKQYWIKEGDNYKLVQVGLTHEQMSKIIIVLTAIVVTISVVILAPIL